MTLRTTVAAGVAVLVLGGAGYGLGASLAGDAGSPAAASLRGPMDHMGSGPAHSGGATHDGGSHAMPSMQVESELGYLAHMIPHHEEAIAAARVLLAGTERPEMRTFAESIIRTQSAEVTQIRAFLARWYPEQDASVHYEPMMRELSGLTGDELDRAFLEDMIPHHMHAVMMSQQLLIRDLAEHQQVAELAATIRDAQHAEIGTMTRWLGEWFGARPAGGMGPGRMLGRWRTRS